MFHSKFNNLDDRHAMKYAVLLVLLLPGLLPAAAPSRSTFTQPFGFWSAQTNDTDFGVAVRAVVPAGLSTNFITTQASNGVVVAAGNNVTVGAAGAAGKMTYTVNGVGTNGFVDSSITNGLATTNYVNGITNGLTGTFQWGSDLLSNLVNNPYHEYTNIGAFQATNANLTSWALYSTNVVQDTVNNSSNALRTDLSNLQGATNGLQSMALAASNSVVVSSNAIRTDLSNLQGATNGIQAMALAASNSVVVTSNALRTDIGNLQGATNGLNTRVGNLEGSSNLTAYALVSSTAFLTNWGNAISNYVTAATNSASVTNWINARQPASDNLTNWSNIPTGAMANVVSANFLTNWANSISNLLVANDTTTSNALNTAIIAATNSASVTNWINLRQTASAVLSNIVGMASFYWTNAQASSMVLSNLVGLGSTVFTNQPLGGTNISLRTAGGTNFIDTTGHLNNWSQIPTGAMANVVSTDFLTNWANSISNAGASHVGPTRIMSNNLATAGGISAGLATNIVFKYPAGALLFTNNSGSNSVEITINPYPPFAILDATNYLFATPDWELAFNEEFNGVLSTTPGSANIGMQYWDSGSQGTLPSVSNPILENAMSGFFSLAATQANSGISILNSSSPCWSATNQEIFLFARIKMWRTNDANDQGCFRLGLVSSSSDRSDPGNSIHIRSTTNANNQLQLLTIKSLTSTISTAAASIIQNAWTNVAFYLDGSGTNVMAYIGNSATNLTSFATNVANIPNAILLAPWFNNYKLKASAGNTGHTNSIDYLRIWVRRKTP